MITTRISEQKLLDELEKGRANLLTEVGRVLLEGIRRNLQTSTSNLYILDWIAEQGEDLYDVLVDGTLVAHVEIPRGTDRETAFEVSSVEAYARPPHSRSFRRTLEAAMKLARELATTFAMHQVVRVVRDVPEQGVKEGMIGAVIVIFERPVRAYEIEVVDGEGRTIVQATLTETDLEVVNSDATRPG